MLRFDFTDINDNTLTLSNPVYIVINQDENIPADDLSVVFPLKKDTAELCNVSVYDGERLVFKGVVDEQQSIINSDKRYTKITARSMAAMLLDNESRPVSYTNISTSVIFERHLKPNGIEGYSGGDKVLKESLNIMKGTTDWQAFYSFAIKAYNKIPRIKSDGTADFRGVRSDDILKFSDKNGIKYSSLKENNKRCKLISDVFVKAGMNSGYNVGVSEPKVKNRKINRRRYLDVSAQKDFDTADLMLKNGVKNSYEVTIKTPLRIIDRLGAQAEIENTYLGTLKGLYVSSIYYKLTPDNEETTLILKENKNVDS